MLVHVQDLLLMTHVRVLRIEVHSEVGGLWLRDLARHLLLRTFLPLLDLIS